MDAVTLAAANASAAKRYASMGYSAAPLMTRLAVGNEDAVMVVLGDSTGVYQSSGDQRWVFGVASALATAYPAWTVKVYQWDDTTKTYPVGSVVTVQTGTGARTLSIYNGSTSGQIASYSITNFVAQTPVVPHLVITNYGHNEGTTSYRSLHYALTRMIEDWYPLAGIILIAQNPRLTTDGLYSNDLTRQQQIVDLAGSDGHGLVNVTQAFLSTPNYGTALLNVDGLHPNVAGSALWTSLVMAHLSAAKTAGARLPVRQPHRLWIPASRFSASEGAPVLSMTGAASSPFMAWAMDPNTQMGLITDFDYPESWSSINVYVLWSVAGGSGYTGSTNVCLFDWSINHIALSTPFPSNSGSFAYAAPTAFGSTQVGGTAFNAGAWQQIMTRLVSGTSSTMRPLGLRLRRLAAGAGDNLAENALVRGVLIERAS